ncbi:hypothetical protein [Nocardia otitidiscaviarum]|uniref:hypothetical protein n=1 Tax=Nocardia otitidiscaviarum TaxID=1823 RepID=UPI0024582A4F|nr:hypothetical protein [Nocardia otitidiscaviarum]
MSLADDLHEHAQAAGIKPLCKTGAWLNGLDERDAEAIRGFLADGKPVSVLHGVAVRNGCPAGETRFRLHFRRRCSCYAMENAA